MKRVRWVSILMIVPVVLGLLVVTAQGSGAIVNGQLDGSTHGNVACVTATMADGSLYRSPYSGSRCFTGQLISPTVVLTAAHVISILADDPDVAQIVVTFDPVVSESATFSTVARTATDPAWIPKIYRNDRGVLVLTEPVPDTIAPFDLPTAGLLDELQAEGSLVGVEMAVVGFGCQGYSSRSGFVGCDDTRRFAAEWVTKLTPAEVKLQTNPAQGGGGMCWGDSGGPQVLPGTNTTIGVSEWMTTCHSAATAARLDTPSARDFLGDYLTLP